MDARSPRGASNGARTGDAASTVASMQLLLVAPTSESAAGFAPPLLTQRGWRVQTASDYAAAAERVRQEPFDAVVVPVQASAVTNGGRNPLDELLREIDLRRLAAVVVTDDSARVPVSADSLVDVVPLPLSAPQLLARLETVGRYQALLRRMEQELANMERLGKRLKQHFSEVDQEMRLAGRLQRDFLPPLKNPIGPLRFSALYRPASWVSGDIYDVMRVDEQHVAFYVADAVGHGMASSLLTMFIKKGMVSKRIGNGHYEVLTPSQTIAALNDALAAQGLPNCQFVTACYCLVNLQTLQMQYARGGHPHPLLVSTDAGIRELITPGGLLGLFPNDEFPTRNVQLRPGEKVILYTDGLELAYTPDEADPAGRHVYEQLFAGAAELPGEELIARIATRLDAENGSLNPRDDLTVVVMEAGTASS